MKALVILACLALSGCASLTALNPLPSQADEVRRTAARISDGLTVVMVSLDTTGATLDTLPLSLADKDRFDCAILRLVGHDLPSVTVTRTCGALPSKALAPMGLALKSLRTVSTTPGLCSTVTTILEALGTVLSALDAAKVPSVAVMRTALTFTMRFAGGC